MAASAPVRHTTGAGRESAGFAFAFVGILIFSFTLPFTRIAVRDLNPTFVGLGRALIAAALSGASLFFTRQPAPTRRQFALLAVTALGVVVGFPLFSAWASRFVTASHNSITNALLPLGTAVLGAIVSGDRPSRKFWLAAVVGSLTVIVYILVASGESPAIGDLAMLGAVALGCMGYVSGGRLSAQIGGWQTICWANLIAAPFLILPVWLSAPAMPSAVPLQVWLCFLYLAVFSMFLGFFAWYHGMALAGITRVSQVQLVQAFLSITWAWLLLGERITPLMWLAVAIVVAMIFVARRAPIARRV